ncbi:hypothetical protein RJ639_010702 [Escallonia herrerae]|uniref:Uncharacterized protein n=1 Tax=Escallonia herrerae TaxID=1293975 RepID=A0AA88VM06_9ASTE|nr:hypothetical protein RJ639_010702 [Escallonia herrerae]
METHKSLSPNPNPAAEDDDQPAARRIHRLALHLNQPPGHHSNGDLCMLACAARGKQLDVSTLELTEYMRGKHRDVQERVYEYFNSRPDLQTPIEISKDEHRKLCMTQLLGLVREAGIRPFRYVADDPSKYFAIAEAVGSVDMSLGIKMGVQYSLWGGSVINLGTKKHRDKYFEGIDNLEYPGFERSRSPNCGYI